MRRDPSQIAINRFTQLGYSREEVSLALAGVGGAESSSDDKVFSALHLPCQLGPVFMLCCLQYSSWPEAVQATGLLASCIQVMVFLQSC